MATVDNSDDDDDNGTFRRSGAAGAVAAWLRHSREARTAEDDDTLYPDGAERGERGVSVPSLSQTTARTTVSPLRERTPTMGTATRASPNQAWSLGRDEVGLAGGMPPSWSSAFADHTQPQQPHLARATEGVAAEEPSANTHCADELDREDANGLDVELRLAQAQRERLERLLQQHRPTTCSPPSAQRSANSSPTASPPPRAGRRHSPSPSSPDVLHRVSCEEEEEREEVRGTAPPPPAAAAAEAHSERSPSQRVSPPSSMVQTDASHAEADASRGRVRTDGADWRRRLDLINRLQRDPQGPSTSATFVYHQRGQLRTPPVDGDSCVSHTRGTCGTTRAAMSAPEWDTQSSGNVLVGEDGTVAIADASHAYLEIVREYGDAWGASTCLAVVPMYCIATSGVASGCLRFSVQLWTTTPAPLSRAPHTVTSASLAGSARFAVGVATADFKGPQTMASSFLLWSDGVAKASMACETASVPYGLPFSVGDEVSAEVDMTSGCVSFDVNGQPCGVAFRFILADHPASLFPTVVFGEDGDGATLTSLQHYSFY